MWFVSLALFAEGRTDHRCLAPVLRRLTERSCRELETPTEITDVISIRAPEHLSDRPRDERVLEAAREALGAWTLLFIHADADTSADRALSERVAPGVRRVEGELAATGRCIAVVPVRATEAWAIADGNALRAAFGVTTDNDSLGVPQSLREVERLPDPKAALKGAYMRAVGRRRGRSNPERFLHLVGEHASLEVLEAIPAFQQLSQDLVQAFRHLGMQAGRAG